VGHLVRTLAQSEHVWGIRLGHVALGLHLQIHATAAAQLESLMQRDLQPAVRLQLQALLEGLDLRHAMTRELTQP
jgi:hypothetical protein